jgi:SAM-dependent methyltransferase
MNTPNKKSETAPWVEPASRAYQADAARVYRQDDDNAMKPGTSRVHYCELITRLSSSFGRPIDVLDAGCGTGRYFRCLRNVRRLVGVDVSEHMLVQARNPAGVLDIGSIELLQGDVVSLDLGGRFDFIYSTGVLAEYAPVTPGLLARFASLLNDDGLLFFTAVDTHSCVHVSYGERPTLARRIVRKAFPALPAFVRASLNRHFSPYYLTRAQLTKLLQDSAFADFKIEAYRHTSGWRGTHFDCVARKTRSSPLVSATA